MTRESSKAHPDNTPSSLEMTKHICAEAHDEAMLSIYDDFGPVVGCRLYYFGDFKSVDEFFAVASVEAVAITPLTKGLQR